MLNKAYLRLITAVILAGTLSSCIATKSYKKPDIETEELYAFESVELDSTTLSDMPWREVFTDSQLQQLIEEALNNNLELQSAIQQIKIAEADFFQGRMSLFPTLNTRGSASYNDQSDNSLNLGDAAEGLSIPASEMYSLSLSSSWELDVWGKLTSVKRAAYAQLLQTEASRRAIQTRLIAQVANSYYRLLALDRQLDITQRTVKYRREDVETVESLKESGLVTGVSVEQSIANQYAAEILIPDLEQQIKELEYSLSVLLGRVPGSIERTSLEEQNPVEDLSTGLPADLLRNRPDIIAAEYSFRSAFEMTNNARARFYPSFRLTAEGGYQSLEVSELFTPGSIFYNLAAGITQPIFNRGENRAQLKRSKAQQEQAMLQLRSTILNAGSEVSGILGQLQNAEIKLELNERQLQSLERAVEYSRELLQYGEANYTEVLTAQQNYLSAQLGYISNRLQQLTAGVNLYRALGGGWNESQSEDHFSTMNENEQSKE